MMTNKHPGWCEVCGEKVSAYEGVLVKIGGSWRVYHTDHAPTETPPQLAFTISGGKAYFTWTKWAPREQSDKAWAVLKEYEGRYDHGSKVTVVEGHQAKSLVIALKEAGVPVVARSEADKEALEKLTALKPWEVTGEELAMRRARLLARVERLQERLRKDGKSFRPYQIEGALWLAMRDRSLLADDMGLGKAQPLDEPVLTPAGFVPIGSLKIGDHVIGSKGTPIKVTGVFPQGRRKVYEIQTISGERTKTCGEHLWPVVFRLASDDDALIYMARPAYGVLSLDEVSAKVARSRYDGKAPLKAFFPTLRSEGIVFSNVESITPCEGEAECVCIAVDSRDHLYVTRDHLLTHNTAQTMTSWPDEGRVLVISPSVARGVWERELRVWRPDLKPFVVKKISQFRWPLDGEMVVSSYGMMPATLSYGMVPVAGVTLVADEAHMLKNRKSKRTDRFRMMVDRVRRHGGRVIMLTATPILNEPFELYSLLNTLGVETEVFGSNHFNRFLYYFNGHKTRYGYEFGDPRPEVADVLKKAVLRRVKKDVAGEIPHKTYTILQVVLTPEGKKAADILGDILGEGSLEGVIAEVSDIEEKNADKERSKIGGEGEDDDDEEGGEGGDIEIFATPETTPELLPERRENAIDEKEAERLKTSMNLKGKDLFRKMSQLREIIARAKMPEAEKLIELYEAQNEPVLVFSAHRAPIDDLTKRPGWAVITGDTTPQKRAKIEDDFRAGKYRGIGLTIQAGGVAITLTRACNAIFIDRMFTPALNTQAEDRIHRIGQKRPVTITVLVGDHKIERRVEEIIARKQDLFERAINATSVREGGVLLPKPSDTQDTRKVLIDLVNESNEAIEKETARIKVRDEAARRRRELAEKAAKAWASKALAALLEYEAARGPVGRKASDVEAEVARTAAKMADALASSFVEDGSMTPADTALKAWAIRGLRQLLEDDYEPQIKNEVGFSSSTRSAGTLSVLLYEMQGGLTPEQWEVAIKTARQHTGQVGDAPEGASAFVVRTRPGLGALSTKAGLLSRAMQIEQMARDLEVARAAGNKAAEKRAVAALAREEAALREIIQDAAEGEERENARAVVDPLIEMARLARLKVSDAAVPVVAEVSVAEAPVVAMAPAPVVAAPSRSPQPIEDRAYSMVEIEKMLADRGWDYVCGNFRDVVGTIYSHDPTKPPARQSAAFPAYGPWRVRSGQSCAVVVSPPGEAGRTVGRFTAEAPTTNPDLLVFRLSEELREALVDPSLAQAPTSLESSVWLRVTKPLSAEEEETLRQAFSAGPINNPSLEIAPLMARAYSLGLVGKNQKGLLEPRSERLQTTPAAPPPVEDPAAVRERIRAYLDNARLGRMGPVAFFAKPGDTRLVRAQRVEGEDWNVWTLLEDNEIESARRFSDRNGETNGLIDYLVAEGFTLPAPASTPAPAPSFVPAPAPLATEETKTPMRTKKPRTEKPAPTPAPAAPPPPAPPAAPSIDTFVQPLTPAEVASLQAALARGPIPGVVPAGLVTAARKAIARGDLVWQKDQAGDGGTWVAATELLRSSMGEGVFPEAPAMVRAQPVRSPVAAPVAPSVAPVVPGPVVASQALRALIAREGRGGLTLERAIDEASVMREKLEAERGVHPLHTWAAFEREREALASLEVRLRDLVAREAPASAVAAAAPSVQERVRENIENALRGRIVWFERPGDARKMRTVKIGDEGWLVETYAANGEIVSSDRASRLGEVVGALVAAGHIIPSGGVAAPAPAPVAAPTAPAPSPPSPVVFPLSALLPPRESYREDTDRGILIYVGPGELGMDDKGKPRIFTYARWVEAPPEVGGHAVFVPKGKAGGADVRLVSPAGKLVVAFDGPKKDGTFEAFLHAGFSRGLDGRVKKNTWQGHTRDPIMAGYEFLRDVLAAARAILVPVPPTYCLSLVRSGLALRDAAVLFDPVVTGLEGAVSMTTPTREIEIAWDNRGVRADLYELRLQRDVRRRHAITSLTLTSPSEIPEAVLLLSRK